MNITSTKCSIAALMACGLLWSHPSHAEEQRYLAIQHTDTVYANQGVCAYHFSLDSGEAMSLGGCISRCSLMTKGQIAGRVNAGG